MAVRWREETDAFGWTNESYRHEGRHPEFRLPSGQYSVEIEKKANSEKRGLWKNPKVVPPWEYSKGGKG